MIDRVDFWTLTALLAVGTFLIRFSFLGLLGGRELPGWVYLHLRYVGVAVFPALFMPLVVWPAANGGISDPIRLAAGFVALLAGLRFGVLSAIFAGMGSFYILRIITNGL
ncbi:MAG: AzlD domain-containing protein [Paracoccaceae bacterium]|nr:AzlD domain-containing protein [Paracoccaceae bacterium]